MPQSTSQREPPERLLSGRVSVIGLALAVVFVALVCVVAMPRGGHHHGARNIKCMMQMREIAFRLQTYAQEHDGLLPPAGDENGENWTDTLIEQDRYDWELFISPAGFEVDRSSYFYVPAERLDGAPDRVLLYEVPGMHGDHGVHFVYHDGHIETLPVDEAEQLIAALAAQFGPASRPLVEPDDPWRVVPAPDTEGAPSWLDTPLGTPPPIQPRLRQDG